MTQLTDSEQIKLLQELYDTTRTKIETVLKKYKLDTIPDQITQMRAENNRRHKIDGWKVVRNLAAKLVGDIDNSLK
jgi:hypothetical protein